MAHKMTHIVHKFKSLITKRTDKLDTLLTAVGKVIPNQAETKLKLLRCTFTSNSSLDLIVNAVYISLVVLGLYCYLHRVSNKR